jgi:thioredoxin 1
MLKNIIYSNIIISLYIIRSYMMNAVQSISSHVFSEEVLEADHPVLVDFWAPWCAPCQMVAPVLESLAQKLDGVVKIVKINTDQNADKAREYGIAGIPTLLLFDKGREVHRVVGFKPRAELESLIRGAINGGGKRN